MIAEQQQKYPQNICYTGIIAIKFTQAFTHNSIANQKHKKMTKTSKEKYLKSIKY